MDKACSQCGQMGATGSGLCMSCIADNMAGSPDRLVSESLISASKQINTLMAIHKDEVCKAYIKSDGALSIGIKIELSPSKEVMNAMTVKAKLDFIESRVKDESVERVSAQQELPIDA